MVSLFAIWATALVFGFGLILWSLERGLPNHHSLGSYFYLSGVTLFTLGYGDITPQTDITRAIAVVEAGTGFGLLAAVVSYMPVLYQLVSRREAHVMLLDVRASTPPTAGTLLSRHASSNAMPKLEILLREWERWCAELAESHLSYPMLSFYRSQHANQNWLAALTAITDACAIIMVGLKGVPAFQARMTFSMARLALAELCLVLQLRPVFEPRFERIAPSGFSTLSAQLKNAGLNWTDEGTAGQVLRDFQMTYEPFLAVLAEYLIITLPGVTGEEDEDSIDNWQRGVRGQAAKSLVERSTAPD